MRVFLSFDDSVTTGEIEAAVQHLGSTDPIVIIADNIKIINDEGGLTMEREAPPHEANIRRIIRDEISRMR